MFAFLAAHRAEVFPDADYADLFSPPGVRRPSLPATQMSAVLALFEEGVRSTARKAHRLKDKLLILGALADLALHGNTQNQHNSCRGGRSTLGQHGQNGISRHTPARLLKCSCEP